MLHLIKGDITELHVDAIVNAANNQLRRGGGVCGAIYTKAGPELEKCTTAIPLLNNTRCETGYAIMTSSFNMTNTKYIIHAVGPIYIDGNSNEDSLLRQVYEFSVNMAVTHNLKSIAFPFISSGIFGYPLNECANIAMASLYELSNRFTDIEITMVAFSDTDYEVLNNSLQEIKCVTNQLHCVPSDTKVMIEYHTKGDDSDVITVYGEVCVSDLKMIAGFVLPVHKSLW